MNLYAKFSLGSITLLSAALAACTGSKQNPAPISSGAISSQEALSKNQAAKDSAEAFPASYKEIAFPEFQYVAPFPADFRVQFSDSVTGYIIEDRRLPLIHFNVFFRDNFVSQKVEDEAAHDLVSSMFRRGGSTKLSPQALDDSLEFIAASLAGSVGTFQSLFSIECLTKDFPQLTSLAREVFLSPAFDSTALEIQKAKAANAYEHRFDNPSGILAALDRYANYEPNPRLWTATADEYRKVRREDVVKAALGKFRKSRIVFALAGDFDRDSMTAEIKKYLAEWPSDSKDSVQVPPIKLKNKPGIYLVDRDISQANISMSAPFVKRPHPDYYPAAVASFILGGGSFSSRLMSSVRSDNGLAYSIYSTVDNDYRDQGLVTIALQTKVESAAQALELIKKETLRLAQEPPTEAELAQAKKTLIESLPSLFDSPASTSVLFAKGELLGKKDSHYIDYVKEIEAVTAKQVSEMIAKYFDPAKMTISIVGPASKLADVGAFTTVPLDSLDFRK